MHDGKALAQNWAHGWVNEVATCRAIIVIFLLGVWASSCAAERGVAPPQRHPEDQPCALSSQPTPGDALLHIMVLGLVPGPEYSLEIFIHTLEGRPVVEQTRHIALVNEKSFGAHIALPQSALIAIYRIEVCLYARFPGLVGDDAFLAKKSWVEERWATYLKAQLNADCEFKTRISPTFVDAHPIICTHDVKTDWISQQLHQFGTYYTIENLDALCRSGLVECTPGRTFVDVGAAIRHFTLLAASLGMSVHAVEPIEDNLRLLQQSVHFNGLGDRVILHHSALASPGTASEGEEQTLSSVRGNFATTSIGTVIQGHLGLTVPSQFEDLEGGGGGDTRNEADTATSRVRVMSAATLLEQISATQEQTRGIEVLSLCCLGCEYTSLVSLGDGLAQVDGVLLFVFFNRMFRCTQRHWESVAAVRLLSQYGFCFYDLSDVRAEQERISQRAREMAMLHGGRGAGAGDGDEGEEGDDGEASDGRSQGRTVTRTAEQGKDGHHLSAVNHEFGGEITRRLQPIPDMETWQDDVAWGRIAHKGDSFVFATSRHCDYLPPV